MSDICLTGSILWEDQLVQGSHFLISKLDNFEFFDFRPEKVFVFFLKVFMLVSEKWNWINLDEDMSVFLDNN